MRMFALVVLAACAWLACPQLALACKCVPASTGEARKRAEVVFVGTVIDSQRELSPNGLEWRVRLKVEDFWKGDVKDEVVVYTDTSDCAVSFEVGKKYLVYARRQEGRGRLFTHLCMKTGPADAAAEDLAKLGRPKQRPPAEQ